MRKLILQTHVSLDGFLEGPKGAMDWFEKDDERDWEEGFRTFAKVDTVLLGRKMYPGYASYWQAVLKEPAKHSKGEVRYARWAERTSHIVFSHTMKRADWSNTTVNHGNLDREVRALKRRPGRDMIVYGGATFASALVERGLVDEYRIFVQPAVLGGGKALFKDVHRRRRLKLVGTKTLRNRVVLLHYKNADERRPS